MTAMRRYLIVANRTLGGHHLVARIQEALAGGPCEFHVVVPVADGSAGDPTASAQHRLDQQLMRLAELGATATGELVHADPYDATVGALPHRNIDELIVCTLPPGLSRWLGLDLVGRLERVVGLPITHIVAPAGMPERVTAQAVRVSIYIGESDRHGHTPLHSEIVQRARAAGLAGATVLHGIEGFGASSVIHTSRLLTMSEDLPVVIVIVDTAEHIDRFLPQLDDLITGGLVVRETVDIIKYEGRTG
jgi:PII-like signaling protein